MVAGIKTDCKLSMRNWTGNLPAGVRSYRWKCKDIWMNANAAEHFTAILPKNSQPTPFPARWSNKSSKRFKALLNQSRGFARPRRLPLNS